MNIKYQTEFDRYIGNHGKEYSEEVLEYGKSFVERIEVNDDLKDYFDSNHIGIYSFLSALLPASEHKLKLIGGETLDENEIHQVFGSIILNNEILKLLMGDEIFIKGINAYDEFIYELSDDALSYFRGKYGVKMNKIFSMRDIVIFKTDDESDMNDLLN